MAFGGTLSLPTLHAMLRGIRRSVIWAGSSRILIVKGHDGNMTALHALNDRADGGADATDRVRQLLRRGAGHVWDTPS